MTSDFIYSPPDTPLEIRHKDSALLIAMKPSGLLSVPGRASEHRDCLITRLQVAYPEALLVHRLDMDTSGLMVFARNKQAQRHLGRQFERREIGKTYVARIHGRPAQHKGTVDLPLMSDWPNRPLQMVDHARGKQAVTHWELLTQEADPLICLKPETGRSHQLRVHMKAIGHPIIGDRFYAPPEVAAKSDRLNLHAEKLSLDQPESGMRLEFQSPHPF